MSCEYKMQLPVFVYEKVVLCNRFETHEKNALNLMVQCSCLYC